MAIRQRFPPLAGAASLDESGRSVAEQAPLEDIFRERDHPRRPVIVQKFRHWSCHRRPQRMQNQPVWEVERNNGKFDFWLIGEICLDRLAAFANAIRWSFLPVLVFRGVAVGVRRIGPLNLGESTVIGDHEPRKQPHSHNKKAADR